MTHNLTVYLADLANTKFGYSPATVPLSVGFLKAYAKSKLADEVDIKLFRTYESLNKAIMANEPDILGCAWYGWNRCLTTNALSHIKSRFPRVLTVVGGANAPIKAEGCLRDLMEFPCLDMIISGEGEIPLVNLLRAFLENGRESVFKNPIDGVYYLSDSQELVTGNPVPFQDDINIFPSPYLGGHLDQFLLCGDLMPILQTSRGCPYHCAFCVSGGSSSKKVRGFALERLKAEIDYLGATAKNQGIRFADDNFGLLPKDLELARFIAEKHKATGYPNAIRVYTDKNISNRIKDIVLLLRDFIPLNISFQTMTESVLENVKRKNISLNKLKQAIDWARDNNIYVTSEFIFGLPGETLDSFMNTMDKFSELRIDSVCGGTLWMVKEIELSQPEAINKYGYKVMYGIADGGYTKDGQFENIEIDTYAVANKYYSFNDFLKVKVFITMHTFFMFTGYFKELIYMLRNRGVKIKDVIMELMDNPNNYPLITKKTARVMKCYEESLFVTEEEAEKYYRSLFSENNTDDEYIGYKTPSIIINYLTWGDLIHPLNKHKMIDELITAATVLFNTHGIGNQSEFIEEIQFAKNLVNTVIIPFWEVPQEVVTLLSHYDLIAWVNQNYQGTLSEYRLAKPVTYKYVIKIIDAYIDFVKNNSMFPFYLQAEHFFKNFRSNNLRRFQVGRIDE